MKKILSVLTVFSFLILQSQVISSSRWTDLFSYNNVLKIREDNGRLIAATENGIFFYTPATGELTKLSKANGLHEVKISAFDYNPETKTGLVGYVNGTMDVIKPDGITYVVDIPLATGYTGSKKINHISITGNRAVVSVNYGVSVFDLEKKEFGDTSFFISNGDYIPAIESVIKDNTVYAVTASAVKKHEINVTFPIYSGWSDAVVGSYNHIDIENDLIALAGTNQVLYGDGNSFSPIPHEFSKIKDVTVTPQNILVTDDKTADKIVYYVYSFSRTGTAAGALEAEENLNSSWISNGKIYAATEHSGIIDPSLKSYKPDGPYNNRAYKINIAGDKLWVSTGGRKDRYNDPLKSEENKNLGFYFYNGSGWIYPSYFKSNKTFYNILDVVANPMNLDEVFLANFTFSDTRGYYKFRYNGETDFDFIKHYPNPSDGVNRDRAVGLTYDDKNNLFAVMGNVLKFDRKTIYQFYDKNSDSFDTQRSINTKVNVSAQKPLYYDGLLLIPIPRENIFAIVDLKKTPSTLNDDTITIINSDSGLPAASVGSLSVAVDKNGDAWIGTDKGLRIISNVVDYKNAKAEPVIIEQNSIGEELFRDSEILQIDIDSGNQKWVSVGGAGVFLLSPNGQKIISHFSRENSALPTNDVTDIKVDNTTGKVYFVTFEGIVVYQGNVVDVSEKFGDVLVYPNPVVHSNYKGNVKIRGLAEKTYLRITDAAGNLVHQGVARGGYYEWDLTNQGRRVASGIYFVLMTNENGSDKATAKIAVIN